MTISMHAFRLLVVCGSLSCLHAAVKSDGSCSIFGLIPFSSQRPIRKKSGLGERYNTWNDEASARLGFDFMAAAQLAMDHFNNRDTSVVPELASLGNCNVYFPEPRFADSQWSGEASVRSLAMEFMRDVAVYKGNSSQVEEHFPCAVLGPALEESSMFVYAVTAALSLPQMVYYRASDMMLSKKSRSTVGTILTTEGIANVMIEYLQKPGFERDYLAVVHPPGPESTDLAKRLEKKGGKMGLEVVEFELPEAPPGKSPSEFPSDFVRRIKDCGIKTILLDFSSTVELVRFADLLGEAGMFGNEFLYILSANALPTDRVTDVIGKQPPESSLNGLLSGAMMFDRLDGFRVDKNDPFLRAWGMQNESFVERLNAMSPVSVDAFHAGADYFSKATPSNSASFIYDAVLTVGFGGCRQQRGGRGRNGRPPPMHDGGGEMPPKPGGEEGRDQKSQPDNGERKRAPQPSDEGGRQQQQPSPQPDSDDNLDIIGSFPLSASAVPQNGPGRLLQDEDSNPLEGLDFLVQAMAMVNFHGASGKVSFRRGQKARDPNGVAVGLYNVRPRVPSDQAGKHLFEAKLTSIWTNSSGWKTMEGKSFLYRDGSSTPPSTTREIQESNYLFTWVRAVGLILMAIAWVLGFSGMVLLWVMRNDGAVRRSQPFFMQLLCTGSIFISTAILTLSFDEGVGWTDHQLDIACMATPWFFFIGQIMTFSALFTKLWRLDKVLQFRRRKVTIPRVIVPLLVLLVITLVILIVWTTVDPWTWNRVLISVTPAETYGQCECNHFWAFFGPLMGLLIFAEALTAFFAWKTNDVPEDFRDSSAVLYAIFTQLQAWIIGMPILSVLGNSSANATYFGRVLLIWIFAISSVTLVVAPKLCRAIQLRRRPELRNNTPRVSVTGLYAPKNSGGTGSVASEASSGVAIGEQAPRKKVGIRVAI